MDISRCVVKMFMVGFFSNMSINHCAYLARMFPEIQSIIPNKYSFHPRMQEIFKIEFHALNFLQSIEDDKAFLVTETYKELVSNNNWEMPYVFMEYQEYCHDNPSNNAVYELHILANSLANVIVSKIYKYYESGRISKKEAKEMFLICPIFRIVNTYNALKGLSSIRKSSIGKPISDD